MSRPVKRSREGSSRGASFRCDRCGKTGTVSSPRGPWHSALLRITCRCGHSFDLLIEQRRLLRRQTRLPGSYRRVSPSVEDGRITIIDVSVGGVGFTCDGRHSLQVGDTLAIEFRRPPGDDSPEQHQVVVRRVDGSEVGVEFIDAVPAIVDERPV